MAIDSCMGFHVYRLCLSCRSWHWFRINLRYTEIMRNSLQSSLLAFPKGKHRALCCPGFEHGVIELGKLNVLLIGLIGVILFFLLLKDDPGFEISHPPMRVQAQTVSASGVTPQHSTPVHDTESTMIEEVEVEADEEQPVITVNSKKHKTTAKPMRVAEKKAAPAANQTTQADAMVETQPSSAADPLKESSKNILAFNLWSISELRLRSAYTAAMNDSSLAPAELQLRKKEYLHFVNKRASKCGELNPKFESNINTLEKLTFTNRDVDILECHNAENIIELDRLNSVTKPES